MYMGKGSSNPKRKASETVKQHTIATKLNTKLDRILSKLQGHCIALKGRPYLYGKNSLTPSLCKQIYGKDYERLIELKEKYDPGRILSLDPFCQKT